MTCLLLVRTTVVIRQAANSFRLIQTKYWILILVCQSIYQCCCLEFLGCRIHHLNFDQYNKYKVFELVYENILL